MSYGSAAIVGREAELRALDRALRDTRQRGCRVVLVSGEPGIGKTRLLRVCEQRALAAGFAVARATCYDDRQTQPWAAVADLGRDLLRRRPALAAVLSPSEIAALAPILPEVGDASIARDVLPDEGLRRRRAAALTRLLIGDARSPLLLAVDDLQWIDDASLLVLRDLVRAASSAPLCLLVATRDDDWDAASRTGELLAGWYHERLLERIRVSRLAENATRDLIAATLGGDAAGSSRHAASAIHELSGGVPFYVEELARHLAETGSVPRAADGPASSGERRGALPAGVRAVIEARLAALAPAQRACVEIAALAGNAVDVEIVEGARGESERESGAAGEGWLAAAARRGLLVLADSDDRRRWQFTHELARYTVIESMSAARQRTLHRALARTLERSAGPPALIARHAIAGGDEALARTSTLRAASVAIAVQAWVEAREWLECALAALEDVPDAPACEAVRERFALRRQHELVLERLGETAAQHESLSALLGDAALLDDAARVEAFLRAARFAMRVGNDRQAVESARAALEHARDDASRLPGLIALAEAFTGRPHGEPANLVRSRDDLLAAESAFREARALAEQVGDAPLAVSLLQELGVIGWALAESDVARVSARGLLADALAAFRAVDDRRGELTALIALAYRRQVTPEDQARHAGDSYVSFLEEIRRLRFTEHQLQRTTDRERAELLSLLSLELYARTHGWYEVALRRSEQAVRLTEQRPEPRLAILARLALSEVERVLGNGARALIHAQRAHGMLEDRRTPEAVALALADAVHATLALAQLAAGDPQQALRLGAARLSSLPPDARPSAIADRAALVAEIQEQLGHCAAARDSAQLAVRAASDLTGSIAWDIRAELVLARCALKADDARLALGHVTAAISRLELRDLPLISLRIRAELTLAAALAAVGEDDEARATLARATERVDLIAARMLDERLRAGYLARNEQSDEARQLTERLGSSAVREAIAAPPQPASPLTPRETEVLRLVAAGHSNREIADRLFISEKTVARHLTNTFTKIDVQSRTQAAAWAFRHGIV